MKEVMCKCGLFVKLDDVDFLVFPNSQPYCAHGAVRVYAYGKHHLLSTFLLGSDKGLVIDHIDRDMHNFQRTNLRKVSQQENAVNRKLFKNNTSGFRGVHWNSSSKCWVAQVRKNGTVYARYGFVTKEGAARVYNELAKEHFGQFAILNQV